ncbi:MAG TPA: hypothetical protein VFS37_15725 [Conexibacter sp.]|nr:hypothetical protein [Conexibacter sp.]
MGSAVSPTVGTERVDGLGVGGSVDGQVIVNSADPALGPPPATHALQPAEALFLRIVSYLAFAESVCVPARYLLRGDEAFAALQLAQPLVAAGLVRPERRAEVGTCAELADVLGLPEAARHRGEWLDSIAPRARVFHSAHLSQDYRAILLGDLARGGGLRKVLPPRTRRAAQDGLDRAHDAYAAVQDGTPEAFARVVREHAPRVGETALRWAMARYYVTPMMFDKVNTRELPRSAAELLVRGGILPSTAQPLELPAPAEATYIRLTAHLPGYAVRTNAARYCEALLRVRERLPEARRIFSDVQQRATLPPLTSELGQLMREELARQQGMRQGNGVAWAVGTSLGGAAVGALVGGDVAIAGATGVMTGVGGHLSGRWIDRRRDRRHRPWVLANERVVGELVTDD